MNRSLTATDEDSPPPAFLVGWADDFPDHTKVDDPSAGRLLRPADSIPGATRLRGRKRRCGVTARVFADDVLAIGADGDSITVHVQAMAELSKEDLVRLLGSENLENAELLNNDVSEEPFCIHAQSQGGRCPYDTPCDATAS